LTTRPSLATFSGLLHQTFLMRVGGSAVPVELIEVRDLGARASEGGTLDNYALLFRAQDKSHVPQGIYGIEHQAIGLLELFLVPIGPDAAGMRYEAIFN
jgi:hypothetical protein